MHRSTRRLLILCLLLLLPFQFSWAAAASYCTHEQGDAVHHFGHHEHRHHSPAGHTSGDSPDSKTGLPAGADPDCSYCHLACAQPMPMMVTAKIVHDAEQVFLPRPVLQYPSFISNALERPNWTIAV